MCGRSSGHFLSWTKQWWAFFVWLLLFWPFVKTDMSLSCLFRFNLITGRWETSETTACCRSTEPTSGSKWVIPNHFGVTSLRRVVFGTRWVCASWRETFAGGVGLMPQGSGTTWQFSGTVYNWCWSLESGARRIGDIKAPPQPTSNVRVFCGQTLTLQKCSRGFGAGRRPSTSGSRTGRFCRPHTVTTCQSTKQFLVPLSFLPSFLLRPILCFR